MTPSRADSQAGGEATSLRARPARPGQPGCGIAAEQKGQGGLRAVFSATTAGYMEGWLARDRGRARAQNVRGLKTRVFSIRLSKQEDHGLLLRLFSVFTHTKACSLTVSAHT